MKSQEGDAFGDVLRKAFRVDDAPVVIARTLFHTQVVVTEIDCRASDTGLSEVIPEDDAFLVAVQMRDCPAHDMFLDGRQIATGYLSAGTTCIYDLRSKPQANSLSPFHHLSFHLPRATLAAIAEMENMPGVGEFDHDPGFGVADPILHGVAQCLLPAFRNDHAMNQLYVDHVTIAAVAHLVKAHGTNAKVPGRAPHAHLTSSQLARAKEYLCATPDDKLAISTLAQECDLPPLEFARAFRRSAGMSVHRWLLQARLQ